MRWKAPRSAKLRTLQRGAASFQLDIDAPAYSVVNLVVDVAQNNRQITMGQYEHLLAHYCKSLSTYCNIRHSSQISHAMYKSPRSLFEGLDRLESSTVSRLLQHAEAYSNPTYDFAERFEAKLVGLHVDEIVKSFSRGSGEPLLEAMDLAMALDTFTRNLVFVLYTYQLSYFRVHLAETRPIGRELVMPIHSRMMQIAMKLQNLPGGLRSSSSLVNQAGPFETLNLHALLCEIRAYLFDASTEERGVMEAWQAASRVKSGTADLRRANEPMEAGQRRRGRTATEG
jgi:hypothetical protein